MANFSRLTLTEDGKILQAMAEGGTPLIAKRMAMGSGNYGGDFEVIKALVDEKVSVPLNDSKLQGNSYIFSGYFDNTGLQTGFEWRELGLYMQDPNNAEKELLYCYSNAGQSSDFIPPSTDERYDKLLSIQVSFDSADTINITIPESPLLVTLEEFNEHLNSNMHFHVVESTGTGSELKVSIPDVELTNGYPLLVKLNANIENDAKLNFNGSILPIITSDGATVKRGAIKGSYIPLAYTGTAWELFGGGGGSSDESLLLRHKETIFPRQDGQHIFTLKGSYSLSSNCLDVLVDGILQPQSAIKELTSTSFELDASFDIKTTTQIDVIYMQITPVYMSETSEGAQQKVDQLEEKIKVGMIKTFLLPKTSWIENKQTITFDNLTEFSSVKLQYATPLENITMCEDCNVQLSNATGSQLELVCDTIPTMDIVIDILYQGERERYYTLANGIWTEHIRGK